RSSGRRLRPAKIILRTAWNLPGRAADGHFCPGRPLGTWSPGAEPDPEQDERDRQAADAVADERSDAIDVSDEPAEVLSAEAGDKCQGQDPRGQDRELLDRGVLLDADLGLIGGDDGHVALKHRAEQVARGRPLLVDQEDVIAD